MSRSLGVGDFDTLYSLPSLTQSTQRRAAGWLMKWKHKRNRGVVFSGGNEENHEKLGTDKAPIWYSKLVPTKRNSEIVPFRAIVLGGPHFFFFLTSWNFRKYWSRVRQMSCIARRVTLTYITYTHLHTVPYALAMLTSLTLILRSNVSKIHGVIKNTLTPFS
jgi:hypothetical protein